MHEIPSVKTYVAIWATLTILTFVTYSVAKIDMGGFNIVVAMGIAFFKMMLVILFFMNVKAESPLTKLFAGAGFFWLILLLGQFFSGLRHTKLDATREDVVAQAFLPVLFLERFYGLAS